MLLIEKRKHMEISIMILQTFAKEALSSHLRQIGAMVCFGLNPHHNYVT